MSINKPKKPKKTKAQLLHEVMELKAQLASSYHFASADLKRVSTDHLMASGVMIQMHFIGGKEAICPVVIKDGLSLETVQALRNDMARSYNRATEFKPITEDKPKLSRV
jgi:hypothetical protein